MAGKEERNYSFYCCEWKIRNIKILCGSIKSPAFPVNNFSELFFQLDLTPKGELEIEVFVESTADYINDNCFVLEIIDDGGNIVKSGCGSMANTVLNPILELNMHETNVQKETEVSTRLKQGFKDSSKGFEFTKFTFDAEEVNNHKTLFEESGEKENEKDCKGEAKYFNMSNLDLLSKRSQKCLSEKVIFKNIDNCLLQNNLFLRCSIALELEGNSPLFPFSEISNSLKSPDLNCLQNLSHDMEAIFQKHLDDVPLTNYKSFSIHKSLLYCRCPSLFKKLIEGDQASKYKTSLLGNSEKIKLFLKDDFLNHNEKLYETSLEKLKALGFNILDENDHNCENISNFFTGEVETKYSDFFKCFTSNKEEERKKKLDFINDNTEDERKLNAPHQHEIDLERFRAVDENCEPTEENLRLKTLVNTEDCAENIFEETCSDYHSEFKEMSENDKQVYFVKSDREDLFHEVTCKQYMNSITSISSLEMDQGNDKYLCDLELPNIQHTIARKTGEGSEDSNSDLEDSKSLSAIEEYETNPEFSGMSELSSKAQDKVAVSENLINTDKKSYTPDTIKNTEKCEHVHSVSELNEAHFIAERSDKNDIEENEASSNAYIDCYSTSLTSIRNNSERDKLDEVLAENEKLVLDKEHYFSSDSTSGIIHSKPFISDNACSKIFIDESESPNESLRSKQDYNFDFNSENCTSSSKSEEDHVNSKEVTDEVELHLTSISDVEQEESFHSAVSNKIKLKPFSGSSENSKKSADETMNSNEDDLDSHSSIISWMFESDDENRHPEESESFESDDENSHSEESEKSKFTDDSTEYRNAVKYLVKCLNAGEDNFDCPSDSSSSPVPEDNHETIYSKDTDGLKFTSENETYNGDMKSIHKSLGCAHSTSNHFKSVIARGYNKGTPKKAFTSNESAENTIDIEDIDPHAFLWILKYIYSGKIDLTNKLLFKFTCFRVYKYAVRYNLKELAALLAPLTVTIQGTMKTEKHSFSWTIEKPACYAYYTNISTNGKIIWITYMTYPKYNTIDIEITRTVSFGSTVQYKLTMIITEANTVRTIETNTRLANLHNEDLPSFRVNLDEFGIRVEAIESITIYYSVVLNLGYSTEDTHFIYPVFAKKCPLLKLSNDLKFLLESKMFNDICLIVGNQKFYAHRSILCARSRRFSTLIKNTPGDITLDDIDCITLEGLLLFIYTGDVPDIKKNHLLYESAILYSLNDLMEICKEYIVNHLSDVDVCKVLIIAHEHKDTKLESVTLYYVCKNALSTLVSSSGIDLLKNNPDVAKKILSTLSSAYKTYYKTY